MFQKTDLQFVVIIVALLLLTLTLLSACGNTPTAAQLPIAQPSTATPTSIPATLPPPPKIEYTPVSADTVSPIVVQRFPRRSEELLPDGTIELVFDRAMAQDNTAAAFTLQPASEQPAAIAGSFSWSDERTMQFTPAQPLKRTATYDVILTQKATSDNGSPLAEPFGFRFSVFGFLEVTQVIPADGTADIETAPSITVMFNRPVVPLSSLEQAKNFPQPLEFEPSISGQGEWLNSSIYLFKPAEDIPGGVTIKATVKAGLEDAAGQTMMADDFVWSFTTQPPEVVFSSPPDGETLIPIENPIEVTFNQPIDKKSATDKFELRTASIFIGTVVPGDFSIEGNSLTFTPVKRLDFDTTYELTVAAGLTSVGGGIGMRATYNSSFTTVPLPKIIGTQPQDGDNNARPRTDFRIIFNTHINPDTVMQHIEMTPPLPITPTNIYTSYSAWDNSFSISFGAKPSTDYEVRISPGIEDPYGNKTEENMTVNFRTVPLQPTYRLHAPDFVSSYDAGLPAKIFISFVNINTINMELYQLDPADITQQLTRDWNSFTPPRSKLVREWREALEAPTNIQSFHVADLAEGGGSLPPGLYYLKTDSPQTNRNDYYLTNSRLLVVSETNLTLKAAQRDALVWATDLGGGQPVAGLDVLFYDSNSSQQLGQAVTDKDGLAQLDLGKRSDRASIMAIVLPNSNGQGFSAVGENWTRGTSPYDFGLDFAYTLPNFTTHIYTDRPIYRPGQTVYFKGSIRAEDDVTFSRPDLKQVNVTIRNAAYETIFDETVDLSPAGTFNGKVETADGAALGSYIIALDFAGHYSEQYFQVAAYRPPEFEVTVEPSATELLRGDNISATINATYFFGGALPKADVSWNLLAETYRFSSPQLGGYSFTDSDDPYTCFGCWWWYQDTTATSISSGSGSTDASGQLNINIDGKTVDGLLDTGGYKLTIEANVTGTDNQFISGRKSLILHKGDYYIGLSPQEYVADAGQETAVDLVAVDWNSQRLPDKAVEVQIVRHNWINSFVANESGGGYWEYKVEKKLINSFALTTDNLGEAIARFTPPTGGSYQVIVQDSASLTTTQNENDLARSNIRSSTFIWVAGKDNVSWRRENHDRITLIGNKAEYAPGETAEIMIPSPFEGEHYALITVERGRIIEQKVIKLNSNSLIYRLPIKEEYAPNIYLSVVLIQGREGEQSGDLPRLADYKIGILPIDVTPTAKLLNISLSANVKQAQPGEEVTYNLQVTDVDGQPVVAEFSLDLVDKAILTLQPRQPEAIVKAYYNRRGLGVNTANSLAVSINRLIQELASDLGLEQEQFAARLAGDSFTAGGETADAMPPPAANAAPMELKEGIQAEKSRASNEAQIPAGLEIRQEFSDTAFWKADVVTDQQGQAQVSLTLPDNLTTWVMRGVGLTNETLVGEAVTELVSTKPLLIRPIAPRFFVVNDKAQLAANINNNTADNLEVEVRLAAKGIVIAQQTAAVQTMTIPAKSEIKVSWEVTVQDVPEAELLFAAVSTDGQYDDAAKPRLTTGTDGTLKVFRYTAPDIVGTAGQLVEGGSRTEVVALPPGFDERRGDLSIQLDPSLAAGMRDGLNYLEHYQYECTEQTVSRFLPNLLTFNALQSLGLENKKLADNLPTLVEEGLNKLYVQQKSDGGWGWWASGNSNVYITSYVVFALTKAGQSDIDVSATVLANGQNFLLDHLKNTRQLNSSFDANRHAFVLYALAEGGRAPQDFLDALFDAREKLSHYGRAYLAMSLDLSNNQYNNQIKTLLSDINNAAILSATGAHWEEGNYDWWAMNTDTRSTAIILDALTRLDPENALIPNVVRWLMVARRDGIWETTQETSWALIALTDWMVETGELDANYDYSVFLNGEEQTAGTANKDNVQESIKLKVAVADLSAEASNLLTIARADGNGRLYYSAYLKVYLPVEEIKPAERGIIVSRRYTLESCLTERVNDKTVLCNEVREAKLGDIIRVDLTIIAPNDLYYVVVEDPLPAGAEAIDTGLATTSLLAMNPTLSRTANGNGSLYEPYFRWWNWYSRSELRDEKVVLFADRLPKGTYEYSYTMRATLPGDYHVIPTVATELYFPEVFGRSDGRLLSIGK